MKTIKDNINGKMIISTEEMFNFLEEKNTKYKNEFIPALINSSFIKHVSYQCEYVRLIQELNYCMYNLNEGRSQDLPYIEELNTDIKNVCSKLSKIIIYIELLLDNDLCMNTKTIHELKNNLVIFLNDYKFFIKTNFLRE